MIKEQDNTQNYYNELITDKLCNLEIQNNNLNEIWLQMMPIKPVLMIKFTSNLGTILQLL